MVHARIYGQDDHVAKIHMIPDSLLESVEAEMQHRYGPIIYEDERQIASIDRPGMIMVDRGIESFHLGEDFVVQVPTTDIEYFFAKLQGNRIREIDGHAYVKIHGWMSCIVLTVAQRDELVARIKPDLDTFRVKAMAENLEFDRRLASINKYHTIIATLPRCPIKGGEN